MPNREDQVKFERYQFLYRKGIKDLDLSGEEEDEVESLKIQISDKIGKEIYEEDGSPVYAICSRTNRKLFIQAKLGYQIHHLIPYKTREHPMWEASEMTINDEVNLLQLPSKAAAFILQDGDLAVHEGFHVEEIKERILKELKYNHELGIINKWKPSEFKEKLLEIISVEKQRCFSDKSYLNKTHEKHQEVLLQVMNEFKIKALSFVLSTSLALGGAGLAKEEIPVEPHPLIDPTIYKMVSRAAKGINDYPFKPVIMKPLHPKQNPIQNSIRIRQCSPVSLRPSNKGSIKVNIKPFPIFNKMVVIKNKPSNSRDNGLFFQFRSQNALKQQKSLKSKDGTLKSSNLDSQFLKKTSKFKKPITTRTAHKPIILKKKVIFPVSMKLKETIKSKTLVQTKRTAYPTYTVLQPRPRVKNSNLTSSKKQIQEPIEQSRIQEARKQQQLQSQQVREQARKQQQFQTQQKQKQKREINRESTTIRQQQIEQTRNKALKQQQPQTQRTVQQTALRQQQQIQQARNEAIRQQQLQRQRTGQQAILRQQQQAQQARNGATRQQQLQTQRTVQQVTLRQQQTKQQQQAQQTRNEAVRQQTQRAAQQAATLRQQQIRQQQQQLRQQQIQRARNEAARQQQLQAQRTAQQAAIRQQQIIAQQRAAQQRKR